MDLRTVILRISFLVIFCKMLAFGFVQLEDRGRCITSRPNKLLKVSCFRMDLREVPQNLKSSVEILDLSYNRIKKLKTASFHRYTDVRYLLLADNMIRSTEPGAFEPLTSVEEIDLSNNALATIPMEIFNLPKLRNLYIYSNELLNLEQDMLSLGKPIRAPLEYLNMADCSLNNIPDFGVLPHLLHINVSSNALTEMRVEQFSAMCNLRSGDLTRTLMSDCTCQQVQNHFLFIGAKTQFLPICKKLLEPEQCPVATNETVYTALFDQCKSAEKYEKTVSTMIYGAGWAAGVLLVLLMIWCCWCSRRKKKSAKKKKAAMARKQYVVSPKNAINVHPDDELLHCDTA